MPLHHERQPDGSWKTFTDAEWAKHLELKGCGQALAVFLVGVPLFAHWLFCKYGFGKHPTSSLWFVDNSGESFPLFVNLCPRLVVPAFLTGALILWLVFKIAFGSSKST